MPLIDPFFPLNHLVAFYFTKKYKRNGKTKTFILFAFFNNLFFFSKSK